MILTIDNAFDFTPIICQFQMTKISGSFLNSTPVTAETKVMRILICQSDLQIYRSVEYWWNHKASRKLDHKLLFTTYWQWDSTNSDLYLDCFLDLLFVETQFTFWNLTVYNLVSSVGDVCITFWSWFFPAWFFPVSAGSWYSWWMTECQTTQKKHVFADKTQHPLVLSFQANCLNTTTR